MGIEPTRPAWKAGILPLNYTRTLPRATLIIILNPFAKVKSFFKKNLFFSKLFCFLFLCKIKFANAKALGTVRFFERTVPCQIKDISFQVRRL